MQETDFPATDGFAPIDPPILLGFDPAFLIGLILLVLAVAAAMYLFGRWRGGEGSGSDDAPAEIHAAILKLSGAAMGADSNHLRGRVQALRDLIERLLGPVLTLNTGLSDALEDMDRAIEGKPKSEHGHGHGGQDHGHGGDGHAKGAGGHGGASHKPAHDDHASGSAAAASSTIAVIGLPIHIHTAPEAAPAHGGGHGETHPKALTHDEQTSALALAARRFHDHWSRSDLRIRELRAARAALSRRPPADGGKSDGGGASGSRVWDRR